MKQAFNPYLPSYEYIPDGEPHVFGDRIYIYGSHDRFNGAAFCLNDYISYSADLKDLTDWRYEGVIYRKEQDPVNQNIPVDAPASKPDLGLKAEEIPGGSLNPPGVHAMWAPDVARGPDGRYYLYYCMDSLPAIGVAVCDTPAGAYAYYGRVRYPDGTPLGERQGDHIQFDPGVLVDDDGGIYLYSGNASMYPEDRACNKQSQVMCLENDMLTLKTEPRPLLPDVFTSKGTGYEEHEFFEASSIRKIGGMYYLIYSSVRSHELCYAVSDKPDSGFRYGGTVIDIGDIFLNGRSEKDSLNCFGNTHGGIECVADQWYVFYHRQTNRTQFSRQACAEKIVILPDGRIPQAEVTSCGLNKGPLAGKGVYPARICCRLTGKDGVPLSDPREMDERFPYLTQDIPDISPEEASPELDRETPVQYIRNLRNGAAVGYKYFDLKDTKEIVLTLRGCFAGKVSAQTEEETVCGETEVCCDTPEWKPFLLPIAPPTGARALSFRFEGEGSIDFQSFTLR